MSFNLDPEVICKQKWEPWFKRGKWNVMDFTQPKSANFRIVDLLKSLEPLEERKKISIDKELRIFLSNLRFPFDGIAIRGPFMFSFDYKYKERSPHGIAIEKEDYDKYWRWQLPLLYLLIYEADKNKLLMHQIRDPSVFELFRFTEETPHYDITEYCYLPIPASKQIGIQIPSSFEEAIAQLLKINEIAESPIETDATPGIEHFFDARKMLNKGPMVVSIKGRTGVKEPDALLIQKRKKQKVKRHG